MTFARRGVGALAGVLLVAALMALGPSTPAQTADSDTADSDTAEAAGAGCTRAIILWECQWTEPPAGRFTGTQSVAGWFRNPAEVTKITLMLRQLQGPGCEAPDQAIDPSVSGDGSFPFSFTVTPPCNGTYTLTVEAESTYIVQPDNSLDGGTVAVEIPPPAVTAITATINTDRTVTVKWSDASPVADLVGYQVERSVNGGTFSAIGSVVPKGTTTFTDAAPPATATTLRYQIRSIRPGATADASRISTAAAGQAIDFTLPTTTTLPTDTTVRVDDPGAGGGGNGGGGGGGSGGSGSGPRRPTPTTIPLPDLGSGTTLPLDDIEPGDDPTVSDEELATGNVVQNFEDDSEPNRGLVVPIAAGLVLLMWAMHLRFVTRQAAAAGPPPAPVRWDE